jgi:hypothetical protein
MVVYIAAFNYEPVALLCMHYGLPALSGSTTIRLLAPGAKLNVEMRVIPR